MSRRPFMLVVVVRKYGLRNIARKILAGSLVLAAIHAAFYWYAKYQCGGWGGDVLSLTARKFASFDSAWTTAATILGFPLGLLNVSGAAGIGVMMLNSLLWGVLLSLVVVPAFVKK